MGAEQSVTRRQRVSTRSRKGRSCQSQAKLASACLERSREKYLSRQLSESAQNLAMQISVADGDADRGETTPTTPNDVFVQHVDLTELAAVSDAVVSGQAAPLAEGESSRMAEIETPLICTPDVSRLEMEMTQAVESYSRIDTRESNDKIKVEKGRMTFKPLGRYDRAPSFLTAVDHKAAKINPEEYNYQFENLVFEGGGNKGLAYCGATRYLEELGIMNQVKRLAGTSAGGMTAALIAVGFHSYEIEQFLSDRIDKIFLDASCGYCSLLPNLVRNFGWNPGQRIYEWFGDKLKQKTGNADITFQEVYEKYDKKLCIVVTNLSQMSTEYCYPKTTPDMPVRTAVRMSLAIPGMFSAMRYKNHGQEDVYVDGGVLCNYPIHCFDGWYLSMKPENSFVRRLQPLCDIPFLMEHSNRFGTFNEKTLGMLLYSDAEEDILRMSLEGRVGCLRPAKPEPETKLYRDRMKEAKLKQRAAREYTKVVRAVDSFLRVLKKHNIDNNDMISMNELEAAFKDETEFPREEAEVLFGEDFTPATAFHILDKNDSGQVRFDELVRFIEENGVCLHNRFLGYERKDIPNFMSFLNALQDCLIYNVKKLYVQGRDIRRTVGINTGHIHTTDFVLDEADREFVVKRGYNSMKSFLQYYAVKYPENVKKKFGTHLSVTSPETVKEEPEPENAAHDACGADTDIPLLEAEVKTHMI